MQKAFSWAIRCIAYCAGPRALVCTSIALLSGCADLSAVSDYAKDASGTVGSTVAAQRWRDSERLLLANRVEGDAPACVIGRADRAPQAQFDAAYTQVVEVHEQLQAYYDALAELAGDRPPLPRPDRVPSLEALSAMGAPIQPKDEAALRAVSSLGRTLLDGKRRVALREVMRESHDDVTRLLALLERLAGIYAAEIRGEAIQATNYVRCATASTDPAVQFLARRERLRLQARYDRDLATLETYRATLRTLQTQHGDILAALGLSAGEAQRAVKVIAQTGKQLAQVRQALAAMGQ